jgi:hypothetical protein
MMKKQATLVLLVLMLLLQQIGYTQLKLSIDNINSVHLRNSGPIIADEEIKGYYLFYQSDKIDKHTNEYTLQILDENLNKVKNIKFTDSKNIALIESSYNGSDIMFMFYDNDNEQMDYRTYGVDGKQKFSYQQPIDKKSRDHFAQILTFYKKSEEIQSKSLYSIENKGFVAYMPLREGNDYTYRVHFYETDQKKEWTYNPTNPQKIELPQFLGYSDSVVVFEVMKRNDLFSTKMESWVLGIYLHNGKKAFEFQTNNGKYNFFPMNVASLRSKDQLILMGIYFDKDDKIVKDQSLGLGMWVLNNQGKLTYEKYNSWEGDISKYLKMDSRGRVKDLGYLFFHKITQTEHGKILAVGECFKTGLSKTKVTDMVMLQFDNKFDIQNAQIFAKNINSVDGGGGPFKNGQLMGYMIKYLYDGFDYAFSQTDKLHSTLVVGYTDYVRSNDYKGLTFNTISYYNNNFTTDKIDLKSSSSSMRILPAKTGSIMVLEYFKKDKRLDMRLEKIN